MRYRLLFPVPLFIGIVNLTKLVTRPVTWTLLACIKCYQLFISPILPSTCRFSPTCSEYTRRAIRKHGVLIGLVLGVRRLFRCHPWGGSGFDPVPTAEQRSSVVSVSDPDPDE